MRGAILGALLLNALSVYGQVVAPLWNGAQLTVSVNAGIVTLLVESNVNGWIGVGIKGDGRAMQDSSVVAADQDNVVAEYSLESTMVPASWTNGVQARAWWANGKRAIEVIGTSIGGRPFNVGGDQSIVIAEGTSFGRRHSKSVIAVINFGSIAQTESPTEAPTVIVTTLAPSLSPSLAPSQAPVTSSPSASPTTSPAVEVKTEAPIAIGGDSLPLSMFDQSVQVTLTPTESGDTVVRVEMDNINVGWAGLGITPNGMPGSRAILFENLDTTTTYREVIISGKQPDTIEDASEEIFKDPSAQITDDKLVLVIILIGQVDVGEEKLVFTYGDSQIMSYHGEQKETVEVAWEQIGRGSVTIEPSLGADREQVLSLLDDKVQVTVKYPENGVFANSPTKMQVEIDQADAGWVTVGVTPGGMPGSRVLLFENLQSGGLSSRQAAGTFRELLITGKTGSSLTEVAESDRIFEDGEIEVIDGKMRLVAHAKANAFESTEKLVVAYGPSSTVSYHGELKEVSPVEWNELWGTGETSAPSQGATLAPSVSELVPQPNTLPALGGKATISFELNDDSTVAEITCVVDDESAKWVAVGISPDGNMIGSKVVAGESSNDNVNEFSLNSKDANAAVQLAAGNGVSDQSFVIADGKSTLKFVASSIGGTALNLQGTDNLVVAFGEDERLSFHRRSDRESITVDWQSGVGAGAGDDNSENLLMAHAVIMVVVYLYFMPIAVLSSGFRNALHRYSGKPDTWWKIHRPLQMLAVLLAVIALILAVAARTTHFDTTHTRLGLAVVIASFLQPMMAGIRHKQRAFWLLKHLFFAFFIFIGAVITVNLGLGFADLFFSEEFASSIEIAGTVGVFFSCLTIGVITFYRFQKHCKKEEPLPHQADYEASKFPTQQKGKLNQDGTEQSFKDINLEDGSQASTGEGLGANGARSPEHSPKQVPIQIT